MIPLPGESDTAVYARKSLVAACDIKAGSVFSESLIAIKRPGTGLAPKEKSSLIGRTAKVYIQKDQVITPELLV